MFDKVKGCVVRSDHCIQDNTKIIVYPGALGRVNDVGCNKSWRFIE